MSRDGIVCQTFHSDAAILILNTDVRAAHPFLFIQRIGAARST